MDDTVEYARTFFSRHKLNPRCVILTAVPSILDTEQLAEIVAKELGSTI